MIRQALRQSGRGARAAVSDAVPLPAPTGGWDAVSPLSKMKPDRAIVLDNWFPSTGYVEVRRGYTLQSAGMGSGVVETLMVYQGVTSATSKLFAVTGSSIWDATTAAGNATVTTETGLSNNRWQWVNFTTAAAKFLWACNGADAPRHYNGSVWAQPALTGVTASDIVHVAAHKNRLWFVFKDSTKAGYLPTGAVAGAVSTLELGDKFTKGGYLNAIATWTRDNGLGPDDLLAFISSQGQIALYQGTDPSSSTTWSIVGVFDLGRPLGRRCFTRVAGDIALINIDGVLPLSLALQTDRGATAGIAITKNINNAMNTAARSYAANFGWELVAYPRGTKAILNVPIQEGQTQHQYVMNTLTGAWCRFTGINVNCWVVFNDNLYAGGNGGRVYKADTGAYDLDASIVAVGQCAYTSLGAPGAQKQITLVQPLITTDSDGRPALGVSTDYADNAVLGTPVSAQSAAALYDEAVWDTATYPVESRNISDWTAISAPVGQAISVHFRAQIGRDSGISLWGDAQWGVDKWSFSTTGEVVMQLNGFNAIYERGGLM